jgi:hypothetical protein
MSITDERTHVRVAFDRLALVHCAFATDSLYEKDIKNAELIYFNAFACSCFTPIDLPGR